MVSEFQRNALVGDIIEELVDENVIYVGLFASMTDETGEKNCLIRKIEQIEAPDGTIITTVKYPDGNNSYMTDTWANRKNYKYRYAKNK